VEIKKGRNTAACPLRSRRLSLWTVHPILHSEKRGGRQGENQGYTHLKPSLFEHTNDRIPPIAFRKEKTRKEERKKDRESGRKRKDESVAGWLGGLSFSFHQEFRTNEKKGGDPLWLFRLNLSASLAASQNSMSA